MKDLLVAVLSAAGVFASSHLAAQPVLNSPTPGIPRPDLVTVQAAQSNSSQSADRSGTDLLAEVMKMVQAGARSDVIKAYIQSWSTPFSVSADDILRLHDHGAATDVLTTLISRSAQLRAEAQPVPEARTNTPAAAYPAPGDTNAPAFIYPYPSASSPYVYSYLYPYNYYPSFTYDYSYYSSPFWAMPYYAWPYYRHGYYGFAGIRFGYPYYPYYYGGYGYRYPYYRGFGYPYRPYGHYPAVSRPWGFRGGGFQPGGFHGGFRGRR